MKAGKKFGELELSFQAKVPYRTWGLVMKYPSSAEPTDLINTMELLGWKHAVILPADFEGRLECEMSKKGRGVFGSWTPRQNVLFMRTAVEALKDLGYEDIPMIKLSAKDTI